MPVNYHNVRDENGRFRRRKNARTISRVNPRVRTKAKLESYDLFILDKSSSMISLRDVTINGFNEVLDKIRTSSSKNKIESYATLVQFGSMGDYKINYSRTPVKDVANLTRDGYNPNGMTALNDATWTSMNELKDHLYALGKLNDKVNVTVYIFTDGQENASTITGEQVKTLIEEVRDSYKWTVTFIGAGDIRTVQNTASNMGIYLSNTANYAATTEGVKGIFSTIGVSSASNLKGYSSTGTSTGMGFFSTDVDDKTKDN